MNVKEIVKKYLEENKYDGLHRPFGRKCDCFLNSFKIETSNWEREFMDSDKCFNLACLPGYFWNSIYGPQIIPEKNHENIEKIKQK